MSTPCREPDEVKSYSIACLLKVLVFEFLSVCKRHSLHDHFVEALFIRITNRLLCPAYVLQKRQYYPQKELDEYLDRGRERVVCHLLSKTYALISGV